VEESGAEKFEISNQEKVTVLNFVKKLRLP